MRKRICSGFLAFLMLLTALPINTVYAVEQTENIENNIQQGTTDNRITTLQSEIDKLNTENLEELTEEEQTSLYEKVSSLWDSYYELESEGLDISKIDTKKLITISEYFNKLTTQLADPDTGGQSAIDWNCNLPQAIENFEPYGQTCEEGDDISVTITLAEGFQALDVVASLGGDEITIEENDASTDSVLIYDFIVPEIPYGNTDNIIFDINAEFLGYKINDSTSNVNISVDDYGNIGDTITATISAMTGYIVLEENVEIWICENGTKTTKLPFIATPNTDMTKMDISFEIPNQEIDSKYSILITANGKKTYQITDIDYDDGDNTEALSIKCVPSILYEGVRVTIPVSSITKEWNELVIYDSSDNVIQKYYNTNQSSESFSMPASNVSIVFNKKSSTGAPIEDVNIPNFDPGWDVISTIEDEPEVKLKKSAEWTNIEEGTAQLNISSMDLGNTYSWPCDFVILVDCSATMRTVDAGQSQERYSLAMNAIKTLVSHIEQMNQNFPSNEKSQVAFITYSGYKEDYYRPAKDDYNDIKNSNGNKIPTTDPVDSKWYGGDSNGNDYASIYTYQPFTSNYTQVINAVNGAYDDACRGSKASLALEKAVDLLNSRADKTRFSKVIILSDDNLYGTEGGFGAANRKALDAMNNMDKCYVTQIYVGADEDYNAQKTSIETNYVKPYTSGNGNTFSLLYHYKNNANGFITYLDQIASIAIELYANNKVLTDLIETTYWDIVGINNYGAKDAKGNSVATKTAPSISGNTLTWNLGNGADTVEKTYSVTVNLKLKDKYRYLLSDTSYPTNIDGPNKGCKITYTISDGKYKGQNRTVEVATPKLKYGTVEFNGKKIWTVTGAEGDAITVKLNRKMPSQTQTYEIDSAIVKANWNYNFTNAKRQTASKVPLIKYDNDGKTVTYTITEQQPSFYTYLGQKQSTSNGTTTTNLYNEPFKIKAKLTKVDEETNNPLSGAIFTVYQWSKTQQKYIDYKGQTAGTVSGTTYEAGNINGLSKAMTLTETSKGVYETSSWLYYTLDNEGKFRIIETKAPEGYFGDFENDDANNSKNVYDISINIDGNNNKQTLIISNRSDKKFTNQRTLGEITFNKYDLEAQDAVSQGDASLSGARYKLYAAEDIIHQDQTNTILYKAGEEIHLTANGTKNGYSSYTYKDKSETNEYTDIITSESNAGVIIDELEIGKYYLKEQSAGEGYLVNSTAVYFNIPYQGETVDVVKLNNDDLTNAKDYPLYLADQVKKQKLEFYKVTAHDTEDQLVPLNGSKFSIYLVSDIAGGKYIDYTDDEVIQAIIDDYRDPTTLLYEKIHSVTPATVYDEENSEDVISGKLVKSITYSDNITVKENTNNKNGYIVGELTSNERGVVTTPSLPYGRYIVVETTTPKDKSATRPFVINVTADDEDGIIDGDGKGTPLTDLVILMDHEVSSLIRIEKIDSNSHKTVLNEGAQYLIHDIDGAWYEYYTEEMTTSQKEKYKEKYGDLVVQYSQGIYWGSEENPYTTKVIPSAENKERGTYIETPEVLPPGTYEIEEINAPNGYVLNGHEGVISKNERYNGNHTYYETEEDGSWTNVPSSNSRVTITTAEASYDEEIGKYIVTVRQLNDPAIGKISVYAEGEQLVDAKQEGSTIVTRIADKIAGFFNSIKGLIGLDVPTETNLTEVELEEYKDYIFSYEMKPLEGAEFTIKAAEDIYSQEGGINATKLFSKGDVVTTLITDKNGQAWTGNEDWPGTNIAKGLPLGKYTIEQTKAGHGFALSEENATPREIEILYAGQEVPVIYKDTEYEVPRQKVHIEVTKKDKETGDLLSGAIFGLYASENISDYKGKTLVKAGTLIAIAETSLDNENIKNAIFEPDIPIGNYYIKELRAPYGYVTNRTKVDVDATYKEDQREIININETYENVQTKVQINLMDYFTEEELNNAQLQVLDENGNSFTTVLSVHNNNVIIRGLEINKTYTLHELVSPEDYHYKLYLRNDYISPYVNEKNAVETEKNYGTKEDEITFKVDDIENIQLVSVFNKPILGEIDITKTGEVVTGYQNETDENGNKLATPIYEIKGLPGAEYVIRAKEDINYPDGYTGTLYKENDLILETNLSNALGEFSVQILKGELMDVSSYIGNKYNGTITEEKLLEFYNTHQYETERQIPSKNEIENNQFLYDGVAVKTVIKTDENGEASIYGLPLGKYEVIEVKAPIGYSREIKNSIKEINIATNTETRPENIVYVNADFENTPILPADKEENEQNNPTIIGYHPEIKVIKNANKKVYDPGETVVYTITVINTGDVDLKDIHVKDSLAKDEIKLIESLEKGEKYSFEYTYKIPENAIAGDIINNTVIATGTPEIEEPGNDNNGNPIIIDPSSYREVSDTDIEKVSITGKDIIVQKTSNQLIYQPGEIATYEIEVINPNAYELLDVIVDDSINGKFILNENEGIKLNEDGTVYIEKIPAESSVTLNYQYDIPENAEAEEIENIVVATGTAPKETILNPEISVEKYADKYIYEPGETAVYTIYVTNTGSVTLKNVKVTDTLNGTFDENPEIDELKPGDSKTFIYKYTIPETEKNGTKIMNIAIAEGTTEPTKENPEGNKVKDEDDEEIVVISNEQPAIHLEKYADKQMVQKGDTVTYTLEVKNTGNQDLTNVFITDDKYDLGDIGYIGDLNIGEIKLISYTYPVDTIDELKNIATVTGETEKGTEVTDSDDEIIYTRNEPSIDLIKIADKYFYQPGETVTYQIRIRNTGNIDLENISVSDTLDGEWVTNPLIDSLKVGETKTLVYSYKIPETAIHGDIIENEATVTATESTESLPEGTIPRNVTDKDKEIVEVIDQDKVHIDITKTAEKHLYMPGEIINYAIRVENDGNVDLKDVKVVDSLENGNWIDEPNIESLKVGEIATLKYQYTVPEDSENGEKIENTVIVNGTAITTSGERKVNDSDEEIVEVTTGEKVKDEDNEIIIVRKPEINVSKNVDKQIYYKGETAIYTIKVTNTGNVKLENVIVNESILKQGKFISSTKGTFSGTEATIGDLDVNESVTLQFEYKITDDIASGTKINNIVFVSGTPEPVEDPDNPGNFIPENPVSDRDEEEIYVDKIQGGLSITKYGIDEGIRSDVSGAEFTMYAKENIYNIFGTLIYPAGTEIETAITDEAGTAWFTRKVPLGIYTIKETKAPNGYYSSDKTITWNPMEWQYTDEKKEYSYHGYIENQITSVIVKIVDDKTWNELADTHLQIIDKDGNIVKAWISKLENGYIIKGLNTNEEYTLIEQVPREGYENKITNIDYTGNVNVSKGNKEIHFTIPEEKATIPSTGKIIIANPFITGEVIVNKDGEVLESWTLIDKLTSYVKSLFGFKKDSLEGVEFTIYAKEDIMHPDGVSGILFKAGEVVSTGVRSIEKSAIEKTDKNGIASFKEMYLGNYTMVETETIEGFNIDIEPRDISFAYIDGETNPVKAVNGDITWTNGRQKVSIEITKKDSNSKNTLQGAVFALYNRTEIKNAKGKVVVPKNTLLELSESGKNGIAVFESDLPLGKYYIKEQTAPNGYYLNEEIIEIDASYNNKTNSIEIKKDYFDDKIPNKKKHHSADETTPTPIATEQVYEIGTGDANNLILYLGLAGISILALLFLRKKYKK